VGQRQLRRGAGGGSQQREQEDGEQERQGAKPTQPARTLPFLMPRNDPTDTGGLFIGRRPGTAPLKYKDQPERLGGRRQRVDGLLANLVLALEILVVLSAWGPQPAGWLWVGSQVDYLTGSVMLGIVVAFLGLLLSLMLTLAIAAQLDGLWRILRRAAGHDQKEGVLARVFMWTAIFAGLAFFFWFIVLEGPGSSLMPA
jgi:hypothetical protein